MGDIKNTATDNDYVDINFTYQGAKFPDIYNWCVANGKLDWLTAKVNEKVEVKTYPRKKVLKVGVDGKPVLNKKGNKPVYVSVTDKSAKPTITKKDISLLAVKRAFFEEFAPDMVPTATKAKGQTMKQLLGIK